MSLDRHPGDNRRPETAALSTSGRNGTKPTAVWAVTPRGAELARRIAASLPSVDRYLSDKLEDPGRPGFRFHRLKETVAQTFCRYSGHIFVMAAGIVVRAIAPLIQQKTIDPAVVVVDETGQHVISLLSGHIGGANRLARIVALAIDATPVITTASDLNRLPAVDLLAAESDLIIENPEAIKAVQMAVLCDEKITCSDPFGLICRHFKKWIAPEPAAGRGGNAGEKTANQYPGIRVSDLWMKPSDRIILLRPKSLAVGIGCNRNTPMAEIEASLFNAIRKHRLAPASLFILASIRIKSDEPGLLTLADALGLPLAFFDKDELEAVAGIENPSATVEKHVGVKSVCEAAAILAAEQGELIVPKQVTKNVTVAIARRSCISSASDPVI